MDSKYNPLIKIKCKPHRGAYEIVSGNHFDIGLK